MAGFARHRTGSVVAGGAEDMQVFALEQIELTDIEERGDRSGGKPFGGWGILRRPCGLRTGNHHSQRENLLQDLPSDLFWSP